MEERIIRAIKRVEFFKQVRGYWDNTADAEELETILTVLRAELDREKNPLTCDGCEHTGQLLTRMPCEDCSRVHKKDRYEPKGEKA